MANSVRWIGIAQDITTEGVVPMERDSRSGLAWLRDTLLHAWKSRPDLRSTRHRRRSGRLRPFAAAGTLLVLLILYILASFANRPDVAGSGAPRAVSEAPGAAPVQSPNPSAPAALPSRPQARRTRKPAAPLASESGAPESGETVPDMPSSSTAGKEAHVPAETAPEGQGPLNLEEVRGFESNL